jgi:hypothetical protein
MEGSILERWTSFFTSLASGKLNVGSRRPVVDAPIWATPEVLRGGFASGVLLAEVDVEWESEMAKKVLGNVPSSRHNLNMFFCSPPGQKMLLDALDRNAWDAQVPEECALLSLALLNSLGRLDEAKELTEAICPYFERLRFYPRLLSGQQARPDDSLVQLRSKKQLIESLQRRAEKKDPLVALTEAKKMRKLLQVQMVQLLKDTVVDDWPLRSIPSDFYQRFGPLMASWRVNHTEGRVDHARLLFSLVAKPFPSLTGKEVGMIRKIMKSTKLEAAPQPVVVDAASFAMCLLQRLETGASMEAVVTPDEAARLTLPAGKKIPAALVRKVDRSTPLPLETLLEKKIISSAEMLASSVQSLSAVALSENVKDSRLQVLFRTVYRVFRERRSLLLLHMQSQVKPDEIPWIAPLMTLVLASDSEEASKLMFVRLAKLTLTYFPHALLPNKLIQELKALAATAKLNIVLCPELAADIFQGAFGPDFYRSAIMVSEFCCSSLYGKYYALRHVLEGTNFEELVRDLAAELAWDDGSAASGYVAQNGRIIESAQILTTHNVLPLLELANLNAVQLLVMASKCFKVVVRLLSFPELCPVWTIRLQRVKNAAFAWRQMILYLSKVDHHAVSEWMLKVEGQFAATADEGFKARFSPAIVGLRRAIAGQSPSLEDLSARIFTGWTPVTNHWALPPSKRRY